MRVLTYNIAGHRGKRNPEYLRQVADLIQQVQPDVVGLQEVIHHNHDPNPEEVLADWTGMHAQYLPAHTFRKHTLGNAVLCREPILETISIDLPHSWPERRVLLEVQTTSRDGLPITVFCTHLVHMAGIASRLRLAQAMAVAKRMQTCFRPHLLMGDLNASPNAKELHPVRQLGGDHTHLTGLRSWPARRPLILYDHIWPGPGWEVESVEILDAHISDHRPLLAVLGWKGAPRFNIMPDERYLHASG